MTNHFLPSFFKTKLQWLLTVLNRQSASQWENLQCATHLPIHTHTHNGAKGLTSNSAIYWTTFLFPPEPQQFLGRQRQGPGLPDPWHCGLVLGTWNVISLVGQEPELVWEMGCLFWPCLENGWTLSFFGVSLGARHWAGVRIRSSPCCPVGLLPWKWEGRLYVTAGQEWKVLTVVLMHWTAVQNTWPEKGTIWRLYLSWGTSALMWAILKKPGVVVIGRSGLPNLDLSGTLILDICACHRLAIVSLSVWLIADHYRPKGWWSTLWLYHQIYGCLSWTLWRFEFGALFYFCIVLIFIFRGAIQVSLLAFKKFSFSHNLVFYPVSFCLSLSFQTKPYIGSTE